MSDFLKTSKALKVISSRFPIGVETMYKWFENRFIMKSKFFLTIIFILFIFNSNLLSDDNKKILNSTIVKQEVYDNKSDKFELSQDEENILLNLSEELSNDLLMAIVLLNNDS